MKKRVDYTKPPMPPRKPFISWSIYPKEVVNVSWCKSRRNEGTEHHATGPFLGCNRRGTTPPRRYPQGTIHMLDDV